MFPSNHLTTNWPADVNGTLIQGAPYQVVRGDTPPPEVRRATPTKLQSAKGSPRPQPETSHIQDKASGESRPIPVMQRDPPVESLRTLAPKNPPVKPAHTLAPSNPPAKRARTRLASDNSPVKPVPTSAPDNLPAKPVPTRAPDNLPAKPVSTLTPPTKHARTLASDNSPVKPVPTLAPDNPPAKPDGALTPSNPPTTILPKRPPGRCKQCTKPTPDVRDYSYSSMFTLLIVGLKGARFCPQCNRHWAPASYVR